MQHLDRHIAIVLEVVREVHGGHAAGAEFPLERVAIGKSGRQPREHVTHFFTLGERFGEPLLNLASQPDEMLVVRRTLTR